MIQTLADQPGIHNVYIRQLRDLEVQKDRMRFRMNLKRLAALMGHHISATLDYTTEDVVTPLGTASGAVLSQQPVLATILRAGLPMHEGMLEVFDDADNAFVSAYRRYHQGGDFEIEVEYLSAPDLTGRTVILTDPMLATGASMGCVWDALLKRGEPAQLHVVSAIASREGLANAREMLPANTKFWLGVVDDETTARGYIVPGLGDAGDLAYGSKKS
jgi:uracil phosphoribosyltransferase